MDLDEPAVEKEGSVEENRVETEGAQTLRDEIQVRVDTAETLQTETEKQVAPNLALETSMESLPQLEDQKDGIEAIQEQPAEESESQKQTPVKRTFRRNLLSTSKSYAWKNDPTRDRVEDIIRRTKVIPNVSQEEQDKRQLAAVTDELNYNYLTDKQIKQIAGNMFDDVRPPKK